MILFSSVATFLMQLSIKINELFLLCLALTCLKPVTVSLSHYVCCKVLRPHTGKGVVALTVTQRKYECIHDAGS